MKPVCIYDIIKEYLEKNGYDGLHHYAECGCDINDLMSCDEFNVDCRPGYKIKRPDWSKSDFDYYICTNKNDDPYRDEELI